jgi:O-antigen/teichoic acid export membrane protein
MQRDSNVTEPMAGPPSGGAAPVKRSVPSTARKGFWALLDQGFVSGARFATTILIGRCAGQSELGIYSLGFSLLVLVTCIQESLISAPYTIYHARRHGSAWRRYNGSSLIHFGVLSLLSGLGFTVGGLLAMYWPSSGEAGQGRGLATVLLMLAFTTPFGLFREFARRMEFARMRLPIAVWIDGSVAVLQIGLLLALYRMQGLNARSAFVVVGLASAISALSWFFWCRRDFSLAWHEARQELVTSWRLGRWIFLAQLVGLLHLQGMLWLIAYRYGEAATGLFAACSTLVLFSNPFALGINNLVGPLAVRAAHERGLAAVRRLIAWSMLAMAVSILIFCFVLFLGCDWIMLQLFNDAKYLGQRWLVLFLGLNMTFTCVHMVNDGGLWALERPEVVYRATVITVVVTFALAFVLLPRFELLGAAWSLLAGRLAGLAVQSWVFFLTFRNEEFTVNDWRLSSATTHE